MSTASAAAANTDEAATSQGRPLADGGGGAIGGA